MSKTTTHTVLVRILIDRYEDTGTGYMTAGDALANTRAELDALIAKRATDRGDKSLAAMADRFDIIDQSIEDNGDECDGEDIGRWTVSFEVVARFVVDAGTQAVAEAKVMRDIEDTIEDVICDSVEEWACNFSADILRKVTR